MRQLALAALVATAASCHPEPRPAPAPEPHSPARRTEIAMARTDLVRRLMNDDYGPDFYWPQHDDTLVKIWGEPGNPTALEAIVADPAVPERARLLAAEVLFTHDVSFLGRVDTGVVADVYAEALARNYTGHANPWGLL
jgi:hypothetical protein